MIEIAIAVLAVVSVLFYLAVVYRVLDHYNERINLLETYIQILRDRVATLERERRDE
jgi:membrane protein implicated in regulation of membrane protease activity